MYHPLDLITASTLGMNLAQMFLIVSLDILTQTLLMEALRALVFGYCLTLTFAGIFAHIKWSRGLRSGELGCQLSLGQKLRCAQSQLWTTFLVWQEAPSCIRTVFLVS